MVSATVGLATPGGSGADRYQPTKLDWLVLQLNAKDRLQNPFGSGLVEYEAAPPDTVVMRLLPSPIRLGQGGMKEVIQTTRRVILSEAKMWGFEGWVQTREKVLSPGVSLR
jgi:hypothetical protein